MFRRLQEINVRPAPFEHYTAADLWTDEHTSARMLAFHLDGSIDVSSRRTESIERSVRWIVSRFGLDESKRVADFGCGPGLYTTRLARSAADVTGIDFCALGPSQRRTMLDKHTIIEEKRTRVIYNWLQYYDRETLAKEFEDRGFTVEEFLGDVAGAVFDPEARELAVIARKPDSV